MEIVIGLLALAFGLGLLSLIIYCFISNYTQIADLGIYDSLKNKYARALFNLVTLLISYGVLIKLSVPVGKLALELIMGMLYRK